MLCVACGPSLTREDVEACRGRLPVLVVNDAYQLAPWADALYAADDHWWHAHRGAPSFQGEKYSIELRIDLDRTKHLQRTYPEMHILRQTGSEGLELEPIGLRTGQHSGYQAINLAVHFGASRVLLLGYDCQFGPNEQAHWFGSHPSPLKNPRPQKMQEWIGKDYPSMVAPLAQAGVEVINCTRRTALDCFPKMPLEQALEMAVAA